MLFAVFYAVLAIIYVNSEIEIHTSLLIDSSFTTEYIFNVVDDECKQNIHLCINNSICESIFESEQSLKNSRQLFDYEKCE